MILLLCMRKRHINDINPFTRISESILLFLCPQLVLIALRLCWFEGDGEQMLSKNSTW